MTARHASAHAWPRLNPLILAAVGAMSGAFALVFGALGVIR